MDKVGVEIIKTEETKESGIRYLNINVSNSEVERNPDIVRLCADVGILEYVKPKTGHWIEVAEYSDGKHKIKCSECGSHIFDRGHANSYVVKEKYKYCPNCGAKMVEPQERSEE